MTLVEAIKFDPYSGNLYVAESIIVSDAKLVKHSEYMLGVKHQTSTKTTPLTIKGKKK